MKNNEFEISNTFGSNVGLAYRVNSSIHYRHALPRRRLHRIASTDTHLSHRLKNDAATGAITDLIDHEKESMILGGQYAEYSARMRVETTDGAEHKGVYTCCWKPKQPGQLKQFQQKFSE